jgi:MerR family transcriptional regulator/heat shock protein HspR
VKEHWTIAEIMDLLQVDEVFLLELEEEEIVCPKCLDDPPLKFFSEKDMENLRLAKTLMDEMGVNLEGVEIILRMRQNMIAMREQFDAILEDLAKHVEETFKIFSGPH